MNTERKSTEQFAKEQEERISRSKIYGDGTTPVPHGIVDILFADKETGKISKYTGEEDSLGRVLILLPFRTPRNLKRYALYAQPSDWTLKFNRGMMVNAVIEDGYVKKLIASHKFMPSSKVIDPATLTDEKSEISIGASNFQHEEDSSTLHAPLVQEAMCAVPAGFEDSEVNPF